MHYRIYLRIAEFERKQARAVALAKGCACNKRAIKLLQRAHYYRKVARGLARELDKRIIDPQTGQTYN